MFRDYSDYLINTSEFLFIIIFPRQERVIQFITQFILTAFQSVIGLLTYRICVNYSSSTIVINLHDNSLVLFKYVLIDNQIICSN